MVGGLYQAAYVAIMGMHQLYVHPFNCTAVHTVSTSNNSESWLVFVPDCQLHTSIKLIAADQANRDP